MFPKTYWGQEHALRLIGKRALLPPLGLLTVAALLPRDWAVRLVDMNVEPLDDADIESFFDVTEPTDIDFKAKFHDRLVIVPRGGDSGAVAVTVVPK